MQEPYKHTVKNFHFGTLTKGDQEFFSAICNRVDKKDLYALPISMLKKIAVRDRIVIGAHKG